MLVLSSNHYRGTFARRFWRAFQAGIRPGCAFSAIALAVAVLALWPSQAAAQPVVASVSPGSVTYGITPDSAVTVSGSGFVLGATITVGTLSGPTVSGVTATAATPFVFVNTSVLRFFWDNVSLPVGSYDVTVTNPAGGGAATLASAFAVTAPVPTISGAAPTTVTFGITPSTSITVTGSNFVLGATITVGSLSGPTVAGATATAAVPFVFTSSGAVRFYWPNTSLPSGSYAITVTNPASAGGQAATLANAFVVTETVPTISAAAPTPVIYGITPSMSITVTGSNFVLGATITVGSLSGPTVVGATATAAVPFVFTSSGVMRFYWPNTSLSPGSYAITVTNPASAGGQAAMLANTFVVSAPQPAIGATAPSPVTYDTTPGRAIIITGTGFILGATVTIGSPEGGPCPSQPGSTCLTGVTVAGTTATPAAPFVHVTSNQLSFYWANTSLAPGPPPDERLYDIAVTNPPAAGSLTGRLAGGFQVLGPVPSITSITPSSVEYNDTQSTSVRITGTNFYQPPDGNPSSDPSFVTVGPLTFQCVLGTAPATATTPCVHINRTTIEFFWLKTADTSDPLHLPPDSYTVRVTNPVYAGSAFGEQSNGFSVTAPQPEIEAIRPRAVTAGITSSRAVDIVGVDDATNHIGFVPDAEINVVGAGLPSSENLTCTAVSDSDIGVVPSASNPCVYVGPGLLRFYWDTDRAANPTSPLLGPGTYDVTVTNPAARGGLTDTLLAGFRVTTLPELISVDPATDTLGVGSGARSAVVELTTAGFASGSVVRFEAIPGGPQITMRSGFRAFASGDGGTVVIDVAEDPTQTSNQELAVTITSADEQYSFTCPDSSSPDTCQSGLIITPSPVVTSITSALVGTSGRTLTITGDRFVAPVTVTFPSGVSGSCATTNATTITCTGVMNVSPGSWPVIVTNPDGGRTTGTWTVGALPVISSITPGSGAANATVPVRILGAGFQSGTGFTFGGPSSAITVTNVTVVNAGTVDATFIIAAGAADGYRTLTVANPDGGAAIAPQAFYVGTLPADPASVLATYGQQDQSLVQYQRSFGSGWSARFSGPALASPPMWQVMKASPVRDERLLAVVDDQRRVALHVWTGQMWTGAIEVAAGGGAARPTQTVDVAFEQQSGRGMAVYATADTTLKYRIWDGAAWTAEARVEDLLNGQPTNGRPVWVRLEARPATNDLMLLYGDQNNAVAAVVWRGDSQQWQDSVLLTNTATSHDAPIFDVAFEQVSRRAVAVWASGTESTPHYRIWTRDATGNGGWLTAGVAPSIGGPPIRAIRLAGDTSGLRNRLALAGSTGTESASLQALIWDGTQWSSTAHVLTTNLLSEDNGRGFDVSAEGASGDFMFVYHTISRVYGASQTYAAGGAWSVETNVALPAASSPPPTTLTTELTVPDSCDPVTDPTCNPHLWLSITIAGGNSLPSTGVAILEAGTPAAEVVRYTTKQTATSGGLTTTTLMGLTRGASGTTAGLHAVGAPVVVQPLPAWTELAAGRGIDEVALGGFDTFGRVSLARWTGAAWSAVTEAQPLGAGLVSVFDPTLGRTALMSGKGVALTLAQHLRRTGTGDTIPPGTPTLSAGTGTMNSVALSWTAVASDGQTAGGAVASYELQQILGTTVTTQVLPASQAPGGVENYTVTGLFGARTYQFDVRAIDAAGNRSLASNRVTVATPAATPPSVTDLAIAADSIRRTSLTLVWTRPLVGANNAPLSHYIVKYKTGTAFVSEQEFDAAQPELRANTTSLVVDGLQLGVTYRFAVKVVDASGASSVMSNVVQATTADHPPDRIQDLRVIGVPTTSSVTLRWTMPVDDSGAIASYVTKYTDSSVIGAIDTEAEFSLDDVDNNGEGRVFEFNGQPTRDTTTVPFVETLVITGLSPGTRYWFSVKASDANSPSQLSPLSGSPDAMTSSGTEDDDVAPEPIADLEVVATSTSSSTLTVSWTATGDDGTVGTATEYDLRYATFQLTNENFEDGIRVATTEPANRGVRERLTLVGLSSNTQYFIAVRVADEVGNIALDGAGDAVISNVAVGQTGLRSGYTFVSIPKILAPPNDSVPGVFRDDVGSTLTVYRWNSDGADESDGCYDGYPTPYPFVTQSPCSQIDTVETGLGYYLYNANASTNGSAILDAVGSPVSSPTYDIALELGFNMVGNPYESDIHLSTVMVKRTTTGTPVTYQQAVVNGWVGPSLLLFDGVVSQPYGVSDPEAVFKPWNGGWIQSFVADAILVFSSP